MTVDPEGSFFYANSKRQLLEFHLAGVAIRALEIFDSLCPEQISQVEADSTGLNHDVMRKQRARLRAFVFWAGLLHDLGKVDSTFQDFLKSRFRVQSEDESEESSFPDAEYDRRKLTGNRREFVGPFHNELSWLILNSIERKLFSEDEGGQEAAGLVVSSSLELGAQEHDFCFRRSSQRVDENEAESKRPFRDYVMMPVYWHHPLNSSENDRRKPRFENVGKLLAAFGSEEGRADALLSLLTNAQTIMLLALEAVGNNERFAKIGSAINFEQVKKSLGDPSACLASLEHLEEQAAPFFYPVTLPGAGLSNEGMHPNVEWRRTRKVSWQQKLVLHILVEADRQISQLSPLNLASYLAGGEILFGTHNAVNVPPLLTVAVSQSNERTKSQFAVASRLAESRISVCAADPGAGKTSIALMAHALSANSDGLNSSRRLFIALPQQQQIDGLYSTIRKDMERLSFSGLTVEGVYNGQRQYPLQESQEAKSLGPGLLEADIVLLTIDRLLSPSFSWRQDEVMALLYGNVVFDEFHAISYIDRAIPAFLDFIEMKKFCHGGGFLLCLSGTPNPALLQLANLPGSFSCRETGLTGFVGRTDLPPVHNETSKFHVVKSQEGQDASLTLLSKVDLPDDTLVAHLKLSDSQRHFVSLSKHKQKAILVHSAFTDQRRKELVAEILRFYGSKESSQGIVVSAKMLNASFDLNFKNLHNIVHTADFDCQILARKNRHGGKPNGSVFFYLTSESNRGDRSIFSENKFGYREHHVTWNEHIKKVIGAEPKDLSHRDAMVLLYDDFWRDQSNLLGFLKPLLQATIDGQNYLHEHWMPTRQQKINQRQRRPEDSCSPSSANFRGSSLCATAIRVDDVQRCLTQLTGGELLSEGSPHYQDQLRDKTQSMVSNSTNQSRVNANGFAFHRNIFRHPAGKYILGRSAELPLIWSIIGIQVGAIEENSDFIASKYYHDEIGLVDAAIVDDFLLARTGMKLAACIQAFKNPSRAAPAEEDLFAQCVDDLGNKK